MTVTLILSPWVSSAVVVGTVCTDNVICSHRPTAEQRSLPHAWDALGCLLGSLCCEASWTLYRERWKKTLSFPSDFSRPVLFTFTSRADTLFPEPWCFSGIQASQTSSHFSSQGPRWLQSQVSPTSLNLACFRTCMTHDWGKEPSREIDLEVLVNLSFREWSRKGEPETARASVGEEYGGTERGVMAAQSEGEGCSKFS